MQQSTNMQNIWDLKLVPVMLQNDAILHWLAFINKTANIWHAWRAPISFAISHTNSSSKEDSNDKQASYD